MFRSSGQRPPQVICPPSARRTPVRVPSLMSKSTTSPATTVRSRCPAIAICIACPVKFAVGLRSWAAHRRTLTAIEQAELDASRVRHSPHQPVERVDFAHEMALPQPADRRIARHCSDRVEAQRNKRGFRTGASGGGCGFATGVPAPDDDNIVVVRHGRIRDVRFRRHMWLSAREVKNAAEGIGFT